MCLISHLDTMHYTLSILTRGPLLERSSIVPVSGQRLRATTPVCSIRTACSRVRALLADLQRIDIDAETHLARTERSQFAPIEGDLGIGGKS